MFQIQLINAVVEWERRLEIEEEKRKNLKGEPYKDFTADPRPVSYSGYLLILKSSASWRAIDVHNMWSVIRQGSHRHRTGA